MQVAIEWTVVIWADGTRKVMQPSPDVQPSQVCFPWSSAAVLISLYCWMQVAIEETVVVGTDDSTIRKIVRHILVAQ